MALTFGFYNSVGGDRMYDARDFSALFNTVIQDGVIQDYGSRFNVVTSAGLVVTVGTGWAWFKGTWTLNDAPMNVTLPAAHAAQPRYDAVVLEINQSTAVRANSIKVVSGVAAASPSKPLMTNTPTVSQYPLAYIYRPAASASILAANIQITVNTSECPYAVNRLQNPMTDTPYMRRKVFRGKNLGSSLTADQLTTIQSGVFSDMWVGDYWNINSINWRIVDFDYWYYMPYPNTAGHHLVIMPDTVITTGKMNNSADADGGYNWSDIRNGGSLSTARTMAEAAFTAARIKTIRQFVTWDNDRDSTTDEVSTIIELPSASMLFGGNPTGERSDLESLGQFALFQIAPNFIYEPQQAGRLGYWLRDIASTSKFCAIGIKGQLTYSYASNTVHGVRPVFAIG